MARAKDSRHIHECPAAPREAMPLALSLFGHPELSDRLVLANA
jgi:hypothetical protein